MLTMDIVFLYLSAKQLQLQYISEFSVLFSVPYRDHILETPTTPTLTQRLNSLPSTLNAVTYIPIAAAIGGVLVLTIVILSIILIVLMGV